MKQEDRLQVFQAQTRNVRTLDKARKQINRAINYALRKGDTTSSHIQTRILALVFCAWVEANFSKVLHTPYGFTLDEIAQIKQIYRNSGLGEGWKKCIELGLKRVSNSQRSNYIPNIRQNLHRIIDNYVVAPSLIRNKLAHGQWEVALNKENTALNNDLTQKLNYIDVVTISKWFEVHKYLLSIIEAMIESPNKSFHRDYWQEIEKLNIFLEKSKNWNIGSKLRKLQMKPIIIATEASSKNSKPLQTPTLS